MTEPSGSAGPAAGAVVVDKTRDLVLWLIQKVKKFRGSADRRL